MKAIWYVGHWLMVGVTALFVLLLTFILVFNPLETDLGFGYPIDNGYPVEDYAYPIQDYAYPVEYSYPVYEYGYPIDHDFAYPVDDGYPVEDYAPDDATVSAGQEEEPIEQETQPLTPIEIIPQANVQTVSETIVIRRFATHQERRMR